LTNPVAAWQAEHAHFSWLLRLLHQQADAFHTGERPNYELMLDIIAYLREYSDRYHHPREDVAFARLARHCPDMELPLARLQQEHRVIARAGEKLQNLLAGAINGNVIPVADVETAAATYLVYYGNHIAKEEEDVLARAAHALTPEDWEAVRTAVSAAPDPLFGDHPEDRFRELRRQIASQL
jgi:hemerythrin-like domain-containing protein